MTYGLLAYAESRRHIATQCVHCGVKGMIVNERHVAFTWSMFFVFVSFLAASCDTCVNEISFMQQIVWTGIMCK